MGRLQAGLASVDRTACREATEIIFTWLFLERLSHTTWTHRSRSRKEEEEEEEESDTGGERERGARYNPHNRSGDNPIQNSFVVLNNQQRDVVVLLRDFSIRLYRTAWTSTARAH